MGKDLSHCHCRFLDPDFWLAGEVTALQSKGAGELAPEFLAWLEGQSELRGHLLFQTSGTTGASKWVAISKEALLKSAAMVNRQLGVEVGDRWGLVLPYYHVGGFGVLARSFLTGAHCSVYYGKWDPVRFSGFISEHKVEHISLVPTQVVDLVKCRCVVPPSVKTVVVGGGALSDSIYQEAQNLGWPILRSYGMTEASSQIATGDDSNAGLMVLEGWEIQINAEGLIQWRGEAGMTAYVTEVDGIYQLLDPYCDGWFTTSDLGAFDGLHLSVLGRADQSVKILGELVDLAQLENELERHTGRSCVVFAEDDERRGKRLQPVIEGAELEIDLSSFRGLKGLLPVHFCREFPRSDLGKIKRKALRGMLY